MIYCIDFLIILIIPPQVCRCGSATRSWHHGQQHVRPPCPSSSPGICSDSCPLSQWCHPTISSSVAPFSSCPLIFPSIRVFSSESALSGQSVGPSSISLSNEYSGLISFRTDWFDLLAVEGTLKSLLHSSPPVTPWLIFSYCFCTLQNYKNQCSYGSYLLLNAHPL